MTEIVMNYCSKAMSRYVSVRVLLPFDAFHQDRCPTMPYRTLYFLNGYTANAQQILSTINLSIWAEKKGFAVVLPDGENSFYVDQASRNAYYGTYVTKELVKITRQLFPLSVKREDTFLGGISMGGFGALMLGAQNTETFSKIIALSPAAHPYDMVEQGCLPLEEVEAVFGGKENYMKSYDPLSLLIKAKEDEKHLPELFLCCGTEDRLTYQVDYDLNVGLHNAGIPVTYKEGPGGHDALYWNTVLPQAMEFLV